MPKLRFAIIKLIKARLGEHWEDVVFEYQEERVRRELMENLVNELPNRRFFMNEADVEGAFERAWKKTVNDFKKVTVSIF